MSTTPRKRRVSEAHQPPTPASQKQRLNKGLWMDGQWWCNCEPRRKAVLQETKNGPNKGKFFWKCNVYPFCNFFLWREQAKIREGRFGTHDDDDAEPESKTPSFTQRPLTAYGVQVTPGRRSSDEGAAMGSTAGELSDSDEDSGAPLASVGTPCPRSSKRKRDVFEEEEADADFGELDSDEEQQMIALAEESARKVKVNKSVPATPSNVRTHDVVGGLPTPSVARTLFPTSEAKRQKQVTFDHTASTATISAPTTPSTSRTQPPTSSPLDTSLDVTDQVMSLLHGQNLNSEVLTAVKNILTTSARKTRGVVLGRDSARAGLRAKDEKIARLQERVVALENKEKMHRSQMTDIKTGLMKMYQEN